MTLEEAHELVRQRAAVYLRAQQRCEARRRRYGQDDHDDVEYHLAEVEMDRARGLLEDAKRQFIAAERDCSDE